MEFSRQEHWSGLPFPSPGVFLTQGSNLGLLHCRQILYRLSHQGSPRTWGLGCVSSLRWFWCLGSCCDGNKSETNMSLDVLVFLYVLCGDWCFVLRDWWMTDNYLEIKIYLACFDTADSIRYQIFSLWSWVLMTILLKIILPACRAEAPLFLNHPVQGKNQNMRVALASLSSPLSFFFWFLDSVCRSVCICVHVACVCMCTHVPHASLYVWVSFSPAVGFLGMFEVRIGEEEQGPLKSNCFLMAELKHCEEVSNPFLLPAMQRFCN